MPRSRHRVDVFLAPGDLTVRTDAVNIKTIVGSCVAVCLWDPVKLVGGMNHYLLPQPNPNDIPNNRFGSIAIQHLISEICRAGASLRRLQAFVIGGGRPVDTITVGSVGDLNTAIGITTLRTAGVRIARQETGGAHGRKLLFNAHSGQLLVRNLRSWAEAQRTRELT